MKTNSFTRRKSCVGLAMPFYTRPTRALRSLDTHVLQSNRRPRTITRIARQLGDLVGHVLALDDFTKNGVTLIEPGRRRHGNKKLAAIRVRPGVGHGEF